MPFLAFPLPFFFDGSAVPCGAAGAGQSGGSAAPTDGRAAEPSPGPTEPSESRCLVARADKVKHTRPACSNLPSACLPACRLDRWIHSVWMRCCLSFLVITIPVLQVNALKSWLPLPQPATHQHPTAAADWQDASTRTGRQPGTTASAEHSARGTNGDGGRGDSWRRGECALFSYFCRHVRSFVIA